jgi:hypothetical protein
MYERMTPAPPAEAPVLAATPDAQIAGGGGPLDDPRALQILSTEHWSLLASRSQTYNESFSRAGMFLSSLSAAVVALALVAQATDFGEGFVMFALVVLPFVLFIGLTTIVRLIQVNAEEWFYVQGMNRIRHAYLEMVPGLRPYFVTGTTDDVETILQTLGVRPDSTPTRVGTLLHSFVTMVGMVATIVSMTAAVVGGLVALQLTGSTFSGLVGGGVTFAVVLLILFAYGLREYVAGTSRRPAAFPRTRDHPSR